MAFSGVHYEESLYHQLFLAFIFFLLPGLVAVPWLVSVTKGAHTLQLLKHDVLVLLCGGT